MAQSQPCVLVVEDEGAQREVLKYNLEAEGFNVVMAENGDEAMLLVHGSIAPSLAPSFVERMQRIGQDFSQQHLQDQRLGQDKIEGYTLVLGMRKWELPVFAALRR